MDANTVLALCAALGSFFSVVSVFYLATTKIAQMEVKVNTMWDFMLRRAKGEALLSGIATQNSPITITAEAKLWVAPIADGLKLLAKENVAKAERELVMEIERHFGEFLMQKVCIPHHITQGACLLICLAVAKDGLITLEGGAPSGIAKRA